MYLKTVRVVVVVFGKRSLDIAHLRLKMYFSSVLYGARALVFSTAVT